jgi:hypothetical protein
MNSTIAKTFLAAGLALTLGACASLGESGPALADRLSTIHAGLTRDEVRSLAGTPATVTTNARENNAELWIYPYTDTWGYEAEKIVEFKGGVVASTFSERYND